MKTQRGEEKSTFHSVESQVYNKTGERESDAANRTVPVLSSTTAAPTSSQPYTLCFLQARGKIKDRDATQR